MTKTVEFFFDYGSPTTYLAHVQIPDLIARTGAEVVRRPFLLGGVFKAIGNQTPMNIAPKGKYMVDDMARIARRLGAPMTMNPYFIINTLPLMRGAVAAEMEDRLEAYDAAVWPAMWIDGENMGDPETIAKVLVPAGFEVDWFMARTSDQAVKDKLIASTEEAVTRGAFGAPTFFVGETMFFGCDRFDYLAEALAA